MMYYTIQWNINKMFPLNINGIISIKVRNKATMFFLQLLLIHLHTHTQNISIDIRKNKQNCHFQMLKFCNGNTGKYIINTIWKIGEFKIPDYHN